MQNRWPLGSLPPAPTCRPVLLKGPLSGAQLREEPVSLTSPPAQPLGLFPDTENRRSHPRHQPKTQGLVPTDQTSLGSNADWSATHGQMGTWSRKVLNAWSSAPTVA